jgi:hypothetical protein
MEICGSRRIGRILDPSVRPPPRHFHPLACLLPDRPDGDLGVLAQLLDVPGDLGRLLPADLRDAGAHRRWVEGVGVEAGIVESPDYGGDHRLVEGCDEDAVALLPSGRRGGIFGSDPASPGDLPENNDIITSCFQERLR